MSLSIHTAVMSLECFIDVELDEEGGIESIDIELASAEERIPVDSSQMSKDFMRKAWKTARAAVDQHLADASYSAAGEKYEERRTA